MIPQMEPIFGREERNAICNYMYSGAWLTEYDKTRELEDMIADYVGARHCVVVPSGTLALYAALVCLGIGESDRVLVPDLTMIATANAVRMAGAKPIFVDVSKDDLCFNMDATDRVCYRAQAVIVVSLNGRAPDMKKVRAWASNCGMVVIEDACQSLGSRQLGQHLGTFSACGVFSFSPQKIVTTGQGGCIVTDDDDLARDIRLFKDFGRESGGADDYRVFGINLKFTDLQAVVGIEQMKKIDRRVIRKKQIFARYRALLSDAPEVHFVKTNLEDTTPWFVDIFVRDREGLADFLRQRQIHTRPIYPSLRRTAVYSQGDEKEEWVSDSMSAQGLWLPSSLSLTDRQIEEICSTIMEYYLRRGY